MFTFPGRLNTGSGPSLYDGLADDTESLTELYYLGSMRSFLRCQNYPACQLQPTMAQSLWGLGIQGAPISPKNGIAPGALSWVVLFTLLIRLTGLPTHCIWAGHQGRKPYLEVVKHTWRVLGNRVCGQEAKNWIGRPIKGQTLTQSLGTSITVLGCLKTIGIHY